MTFAYGPKAPKEEEREGGKRETAGIRHANETGHPGRKSPIRARKQGREIEPKTQVEEHADEEQQEVVRPHHDLREEYIRYDEQAEREPESQMGIGGHSGHQATREEQGRQGNHHEMTHSEDVV